MGSSQPEVGKVFEVVNNGQLQKLLQNVAGVIVDFWSPSCPPCMRIKPVYESAAKANTNPNLVFATVNTQVARDAA